MDSSRDGLDHAGCWHQRVADRRAQELQSFPNQITARGVGFRCAGQR